MKLTISSNELLTQCQKAYYGLTGDFNSADEVAKMVWNNQMIGLNGVKSFAEYLTNNLYSVSNQIKTRYQNENNSYTFDYITKTQQSPPLDSFLSVMDFGLSQLQNFNQVKLTLKIKAEQNPWLWIGGLLELKKLNDKVNAAMSWQGNNKDYYFFIFSKKTYFNFFWLKNKRDNKNIGEGEVKVVLYKNIAALKKKYKEVASSQNITQIPLSENGMEYRELVVNKKDWEIICEMGKKTLVPDRAESIKDAGV